MKTLHLVCTSHIDPVWQWDWDEGISTALATFYSAVNLAKDYDFIFCHNEVLLYEYIEKYNPKLFKEIQELVKLGKWKIMGGWYVQPDCMVPSGESFIRQISLGREYFKEKFNSRPTSANNFDAFAHTRGLASILHHCGYDSYIICRPMPWHDHFVKNPLPLEPFNWVGYDGSKVKVLRQNDMHIYNSSFGHIREDIERKVKNSPNDEHICILWGVGNHGGGPSREDLDTIKSMQVETKDKWNIVHSSLEDYFSNVNPKININRQFITFYKSYCSYNEIKKVHDELENALYRTEKICSIANLYNLYEYNKEVLKNAERALCQIEFHDVLSGTAIKTGTDSSVRKAHNAIDELKKEMFTAFNSIAEKLPKVDPDDDNFVLFNHNPYEYEGFVELEYLLITTRPHIDELYDMNHNLIPYQMIKEESNINFDRRDRYLMKVKIPANGAISIGVHHNDTPRVIKDIINDDKDIVVKDEIKTVVISRKTGLLTSFIYKGKEMLKGPSVVPTVFNDNEDPWGWHLTHYDEKTDLFRKPLEFSNAFKSMNLDTKHKGIFEKLDSVTLLNDGPLMKEVQALFTYQESHVVLNYRIYVNEPYIDLNVHVLWNEKNKGLKLKFDLDGDRKYFAQAAYGVEVYNADKLEQPMNRYVGVSNNEDTFTIYNRSGIHSVSKTGSKLYLTLFNGSVACAHPTDSLPIVPDPKRFAPNIEHGVHDFSLRFGVNKIYECERIAKEFNEPIYGLLYFPHGEGKTYKDIFKLSNKNIVVTALKRRNDGSYLIRLFNGTNTKAETELSICNINKHLDFKKYQFITLVFKDNQIKVSDDAGIY